MSVKDTLEQIVNSMLYPLKAINDNFATLATPFKTIDAENKTVELEEGWTLSADNLAVTGTAKSEPIQSDVFPTGGYVIQSGLTVQVLFRLTPNQSFSSAGDTTIAKLPDGFSLPSVNPAVGFIIDVTAGSNVGSFRVYTNGTISINMNSDADLKGHFLEMQVMYLA